MSGLIQSTYFLSEELSLLPDYGNKYNAANWAQDLSPPLLTDQRLYTILGELHLLPDYGNEYERILKGSLLSSSTPIKQNRDRIYSSIFKGKYAPASDPVEESKEANHGSPLISHGTPTYRPSLRNVFKGKYAPASDPIEESIE